VRRRAPRTVLRWVAGTAWAALLGSYLWVVLTTGRTPIDVLGEIVAFLVDHPLGPVLYVLLCAVRPLFVFSSSVLSIGAGHLYGPALGFVVVTVGQNSGAVLAYALAAGFGADVAGRALEHPRLRRRRGRLRRNAFETVLTLRFLFAPYDAVNYRGGRAAAAAAPLRRRHRARLAARLADLPAVRRLDRRPVGARRRALAEPEPVDAGGVGRAVRRLAGALARCAGDRPPEAAPWRRGHEPHGRPRGRGPAEGRGASTPS
jgi:hypothetical protein